MTKSLLLFSAATMFAQTQPTVMGSRTVDGSWDASGATATKPAKSGTSLPAACSTGEAFFKTNAAAGQNLYLCLPDNTWTQVSGGLPPAGGDLSGTLAAATVAKIQGQPVAASAPSAGQVLTWSGSQWVAQAAAGGSGGSAALKQLVFDGSTMIAGESMTAWACGSGSGAVCTTSWSAPPGVYWVQVQAWSGGGGGSGSRSGDRSGSGGGGGGYWEATCPVIPGSAYTIMLGLGGAFSTDGYAPAGNGGNTGFGSCFMLAGGIGGNSVAGAAFGGKLGTGSTYWGWQAQNGTLASIGSGNGCAGTANAGPHALRSDGGGCGAGTQGSSGNAGLSGGNGIGGAGGGASGSYNVAAVALGGASGSGGFGGNGGGWTLAGGAVACTAGNIPGGGGGGGAATTSGSGGLSGCNGARGEVRVYYVH